MPESELIGDARVYADAELGVAEVSRRDEWTQLHVEGDRGICSVRGTV